MAKKRANELKPGDRVLWYEKAETEEKKWAVVAAVEIPPPPMPGMVIRWADGFSSIVGQMKRLEVK